VSPLASLVAVAMCLPTMTGLPFGTAFPKNQWQSGRRGGLGVQPRRKRKITGFYYGAQSMRRTTFIVINPT
jgi:hypothetical protein